jgi:hypothetical protein
LQRYAETDLDGEDEPRCAVSEDLECVAEVEFLVDDGGAVALEAEVCEFFFLGGEEG